MILMISIFCGHAAPHIFQTDNGGQFTNNLLNTTLRNGGYRYFLLIVDLFTLRRSNPVEKPERLIHR